MFRTIYSSEEKSRLIGEIQRRHRQGNGTYKSISGELGISAKAYYRWLGAGIKPAVISGEVPAARSSVSAMRPVEIKALVPLGTGSLGFVAPNPAHAELILITPGGYRLEGLVPESAAALLRALQ